MSRKKVFLGISMSLITSVVILGLLIKKSRQLDIPKQPLQAKPSFQPDDAALLLIDPIGDHDTIKPGSITAECLSAKVDGVADQYDLLLRTISNQPGTTHFIDGIYATLMPSSRRPIFQIRFPDRKYCAPFAKLYSTCFEGAEPESEVDRLILPSGRCIKEAAKKLNVAENWSDLIERYGRPMKGP